ncbi:hypothetical protein JCM30760_16130 [Thiomicrorhabdus hydrogeniphila]
MSKTNVQVDDVIQKVINTGEFTVNDYNAIQNYSKDDPVGTALSSAQAINNGVELVKKYQV